MHVALTFDAEHPDRPHSPPGNEEWLLDVLAGEQARATFFLQGRWAQAHPETVRRMAEEKYLIGNHSHYHARMRQLTAEGFRTDVLNAERAIIEVSGADPRPWFRLPFGSGHHSRRLARLLTALGYRHVGWDVDAFDWIETRSAREVEDSVVEGTRACGSQAIVLMHAWPETTIRALPHVLRRLRDQRAVFCTVADLPTGPTATAATPNEGPSVDQLMEGRRFDTSIRGDGPPD